MRPRRRSADCAIGRLCEQRTSWTVGREWACGCAGVAASFRYDERLLRLRAPWLRCCAHIYVVSTATIGSRLSVVSSRLSLLLLSPPRVTPQAFLAYWRSVALSLTVPMHYVFYDFSEKSHMSLRFDTFSVKSANSLYVFPCFH